MRANKTLEEYLKELKCSEELYYEILYHSGYSGYPICDYIDSNSGYNGHPISDYINDNKFIIFDLITDPSHFMGAYKYHYVKISSLEELTNIIERFLKLKVFL